MTADRILLGSFVALVVLLVLWSWQLMRPGPPVRLSKQTTYITEPLADDGLPDYVAYLDRKYSEGVTPENNATVSLLRATGLKEVRGEGRDEWFARLGMEYLPEEGEYLTAWTDDPTFNDTANWLIAYWRSQQDGSELPAAVGDLSDYSELIAAAYERGYGALAPHWAFGAGEAVQELSERLRQRPWTSGQVPPAIQWLEANGDRLDMAVEASERSHVYVPLLTRPDMESPRLFMVHSPTVQESRMVCRGLQTRVMWHLGEGRHADARGDISATHRLARLTCEGPFLVKLLVGFALDGMACQEQIALASQPDTPADVLEASLDELRQLPRWQHMADRVDEAERLAGLDAALSLHRSDMAESGSETDQAIWRLAQLNIDWNIVLERINGYYDDLVAAARMTGGDDRKQAFAAVEARMRKLGDELPSRLAGAALSRVSRSELIADMLANLITPAVEASVAAEDRANVRLDLATTALALALHRARHGVYPESLDALVPDILDEVPIDLFADGPFSYERRDEGYLLYSLGQNGVDDGGTAEDGEIVRGEWLIDAEAQPDYSNDKDLVVRVPMPPLVIPPLPADIVLPAISDATATADMP